MRTHTAGLKLHRFDREKQATYHRHPILFRLGKHVLCGGVQAREYEHEIAGYHRADHGRAERVYVQTRARLHSFGGKGVGLQSSLREHLHGL